MDAYAICEALNGSCACRDHDTGPCDAILMMALNDEGPDDELARIEKARQEAEEEVGEREHLHICESCSVPIYEGDKYQPGGDCDFCPEHAATLADILDFWEKDVADDSEYPAWSDQFDTIEDAREHVEDLRARIERDGADHKPLYVA